MREEGVRLVAGMGEDVEHRRRKAPEPALQHHQAHLRDR
jgi:hypothetical protein